MMPKSDLFGAIPPTPGNAASTFSPSLLSTSQDYGNDFFAMISQAFAKSHDQPPASQPPPAPSSYAPENVDSTDSSDGTAGESGTIDSSKSKNQQSSSAPANKADSVDASVLSTIMAMLAQTGSSPADHQKLVPAQGKDLKISSEQAGQEAAKLSESVEQASAQKLLNSSAQSPSAALLNEPGNPASNPAILAAMKSLADAGKPLPANISPLGNDSPPTKPEKPPVAVLPQLTAMQDIPSAAQEHMEPAVPLDGMRVALNNQRMKFAAEKNEIAGRAVQKLPDAAAVGDFSDALIGKVSAKSDSDLPGHTKDSFDPNLLFDLSANSNMTDLMQAKLVEKTQSSDTAAAQVERVAHLVNQEVLSVRQSGANSLAVSLKVDAHTELFLQLTNHDGQIQASVRCERGNIEGLGSHWGELQQSLARQNVQLMPLEDKIVSRNTTLNTPSETTFSRNFDQSSQNPQRRTREPQDEPSLAGVTGLTLTSPKTKTNNRSRQGWESWA